MDILTTDWRKEKPAALRIYPSKIQLLEAASGEFLNLVRHKQETSGEPFLAIMGGGRTPRHLNRVMVELSRGKKIDWNRLVIFFSDERCVPPEHHDSNYKLIHDTLIQPLNIPGQNVFPIPGEMAPAKAASHYHNKLAGLCGGAGAPVFDLALLGLGADGHTASLFPGSEALKERSRLAIPGGTGPEGRQRITVTYPVFNAAKNTWFIAVGAEKAAALGQLVNGPYRPPGLPAQGVCPRQGKLLYWLDQTAAQEIEP